MKWESRLTSEDRKLILDESPKAEQLAALTEKQLDLIYRKKWFHLLVPREMGGEQMNLPDFALFMEELAIADGSFAWAVNLGAGANMFAGFMQPETAREIFASNKTCVAGSGAVAGKAAKTTEGFEINGKWKYASGSKHATHFSLNSLIDGNAEKVSSFLVPAEYVEIKESWNVMGLKATASCDFEVKNAKVSFEYAFDLQKPSEYNDAALYRFPFVLLAEINMLVMVTGLAKSFYTQCIEIAKQKVRKTWTSENLLIEEPLFGELSENLYVVFEKQRNRVFELLMQAWKKVEKKEEIVEEERKQFTNAVLDSTAASRKLVDGIFPMMAMSVIYKDSRINRSYRDFKVASQHSLLSELRKFKL